MIARMMNQKISPTPTVGTSEMSAFVRKSWGTYPE
jgi:hypothetical protein